MSDLRALVNSDASRNENGNGDNDACIYVSREISNRTGFMLVTQETRHRLSFQETGRMYNLIALQPRSPILSGNSPLAANVAGIIPDPSGMMRFGIREIE